MTTQEKTLSTVAAALLVGSVFFSLSLPGLGLGLSVSALTITVYLKRRGAFREDNTPLLGALLIGGGAIMVLGGVFAVLLLAHSIAAVILFVALTAPVLLFLLVFGLRERVRAFIRFIEPEGDSKPGP